MARKLPDWLASYMEYTQNLEAPENFHFWTGVSVIAGALRRNVYFDMGHFKWYPNFYIVLVAPSGIVSKSTTMRTGMSLLREIPDVVFGPDEMTSQSTIDALRDAQREKFLPSGETTIESCLTFAASEFGVLLDPQDGGMLNKLTHLWDGYDVEFKKRTRKAGEEIARNPWINIIGCTTPSWFADNFNQNLIEGGFASRCIFLWANEKRRLVPYPKKEIDLEKTLEPLRKALIHDLAIISELQGEYKLSPEAEKFGMEWYEALYEEAKNKARTASFDGYVARKQGHAHKIAMVISASCSNELVIDKWALEHARDLLTAIEEDMPKILGGVGAGPNVRYVNEMRRLIQEASNHRFASTMMGRHFLMKYGLGKDDYNKLVESVIGAELVELKQVNGTYYLVEKSDAS